MAEVLLELEANLRSGKVQLTPQEENIFERCKSQALNRFKVGVIAGGGLVWAVTWKLGWLLRISLSAGGATILGLGELANSLASSADHVLALDGTQMQRELANIIVKKYQHDPWKMQLISKHLYLEEVFDDSTSEPRLRWRYRNFFGDNINQDQGTHDDSQDISHNTTPSDIHDNWERKRTGERKWTDSRSEQIPVDSVTDPMADPLDCVFGYTVTSEDTHHSTPSSIPSRAQSRAHKRAHRRRQMRHQEGSLGSHDSKHSN